MGKGVAAVFRTGEGKKYKIESDAIVDIVMNSNIKYEKVRVIGMNNVTNCIRIDGAAGKGVSEIPVKGITNIIDPTVNKGEMSRTVTVM